MTEKLIMRRYYHVDNGGFTLEIDEYGTVKFESGFYGYGDTSLSMTGRVNPGEENKEVVSQGSLVNQLAEAFNVAKVRLDERRKEREHAEKDTTP